MNIKEHLIGGWFRATKPGRAQHNARIVRVFCEGCDVRRVSRAAKRARLT
jgi:hypothetical protein